MLRYVTSGESHGDGLVAMVQGLPAGLKIDPRLIHSELKRRMAGYGRGKRMSIESDRPRILSGIRRGMTIGSPVTILIPNADHSIDRLSVVRHPRPGHADLAGMLKFNTKDARDILERASARETASRVAVGAVCKALIAELGIRVFSHVTSIGGVAADLSGQDVISIKVNSERSKVRCADPIASKLMCEAIDDVMLCGDTLGGSFEVVALGVPAGLGSCMQWDERLDGMLARALMSIQAVKAVEIGLGLACGMRRGSVVHDEIAYDKAKKKFARQTNNAGGIEGGMSNGEPIVVSAWMKPIATLKRPLASVDVVTKKRVLASVERSDICAVPAAGVVGEAAVASEIASACIGKFGGDCLAEMRRNYDGYMKQIKRY